MYIAKEEDSYGKKISSNDNKETVFITRSSYLAFPFGGRNT